MAMLAFDSGLPVAQNGGKEEGRAEEFGPAHDSSHSFGVHWVYRKQIGADFGHQVLLFACEGQADFVEEDANEPMEEHVG